MSLSSGLSSALSGLAAAARAAEVVSSNIANARTEGYGRRSLLLGATVIGGSGHGVSVQGVQRNSDPVLIGDRRIAEAGSGNRSALADFFQRLEATIGTTDAAVSLNSRISDLDKALLEAASRPESDARLMSVLDAAQSLAQHISATGAAIQKEREAADHQIETQVGLINTALERVAELNGAIRKSLASGRESSALLDNRQQIIDSISEIIPLREIDRGNGQIALFTTGGAIVLDGSPAKFGFSGAGVIVPGMSVDSGALSGLTLDGRPISTASQDGPISGGSLAAKFAIRDKFAPEAQSRLDAVARDLVSRFADPTVDTSLTAAAAGLFNDAGGPLDPASETGLAQRLSINSRVDPARGGDIWRIRDGLGAASPGPVGNSGLLTAMHLAMGRNQITASGGFSASARSLQALASGLISSVATQRVSMEDEATFATSRLNTLKSLELAGGVDTDQELQSLMLIEQAYAANAKVTATIGELLNKLMEI